MSTATVHHPTGEVAGSLGPRPREHPGMGLFTMIWAGQTVSQLGSGLLGFALGVLVFQQTGSVTRFALIGLSVAVPGLLLSPLAGVLADRWDRRRILILSHAGSALANLVLFALIRSGRMELWQIYPVIVASACCMAFVWPTFSAATTLIVGKQHFARASGMNQMGMSISQVLAPALAGVLLEAVGVGGIVLINLASYLVAAGVLLLVRFPRPVATAAGEAAGSTVRQQTRYAWRFIRQRPGLRWLLLLLAGLNFAVGMLTVLLTPLVLGFASPSVLGMVLSIAGSGMLVGGILMSVWGGPRRRVRTILVVVPAMGLLLLCAGLRPSATLVATVAFLFLLAFPVITGASQAIWQSKVPPDLQGRVFAARRMVAGVAAPLAFIFAGPLADRVFEPAMAVSGPLAHSIGRWIGIGPGRGIALMIMLLGLLTMATAIAGWCSRALRRVETDIPDAVDAEPATAVADGVQSPPGDLFEGLRRPHVAVTFLVLVLAVTAAIWSQRPPRALGDEAPETAFSAGRAGRHLPALAARPHPVGSPEQRRIRDYLLRELRALGIETRVQRARDVRAIEGVGVTQLITVENVVARLPGTAGRHGSVLLAAHYDSAPSSPGASDNGAAVAALLETARALRSAEPLANDVILLFSDAEEAGLGGARAFVKDHPWAAGVAVALNFDARGHGGPVYMFQTGSDNRWWIPHLARAAPRPVGNSLLGSIYRHLSNDTDFTVFSEAGYSGFNFAFVEGLTHYHNMLDRPAAVDPRSLQHQGSYALALARHLGELDLSSIRRGESPEQGDRAYFDLLGRRMVHYPAAAGLPLVIAAGILLLALLVLGLRRDRLSLFGIGQSFLAHFGALVAIPVTITVVWLVVRDVAGLPMLMDSTPGARRYMLAFAVLTVAAVAGWQRFMGSIVRVLDLSAGALIWWLILAVLASGPMLPLATHFVFVWPLLFALTGFGYLLLTPAEARRPWWTVTILALSALPAILLWAPLVAVLYVGLQSLTQLGGLPLAAAVMLSGLLIPQLAILTRQRAWLPGLGALAGVLMLAAATSSPGGDATPRLSSALYAFDADAGKRSWFSFDPEPSPWTRQLGFEAEVRGSLGRFFPRLRSQWLRSPAPESEVPLPELTTVAAGASDELRRWDLRLRAGAGARARLMWIEPAAAAVSIKLADTEVTLRVRPGDRAQILLELPIAAPEEDLIVRARGTERVTLTVVEQHEGLPRLPGIAPRPADEIPRPFLSVIRSDVTLVRRSFELPGSAAEEPDRAAMTW